ncbi:response regulator [Polycladidibacter hongkongensis]|uniref:response regulator n=1 Tax=Polycladidibacter hongkongensis TaxID=1647556 RepID=UPI000A6AD335|nr:response regulator [Pseudovibrio hongkongensis]
MQQPHQEEVDFSQYSVLIAEDNNYMRSLLRAMITGFGVRRIFEAADGADAIAIAIDRRPDIILCDWIMSPVDGRDFVRLLRRDNDPALSRTPVIVISADSRQSVVIAAMHAGVNHFIAKPLSPARLYERMVATIREPNSLPTMRRREKSNISERLERHLKKLEAAKESGKIQEPHRDALEKLVNPILSERTEL